MVKRYLWIFLLSAAPALEAQTLHLKLDNGMKVLVSEDKRAPVAAVRLWYKVGSVDEHTGKTGLSHALEHMMFKGTKAVPAGAFSRRIAALGGSDNAYTNRTETVYTTDIAAKNLEEVLKMEADRMTGLNFSDRDFANEMDVIREERRLRTEDSPAGKMWETLNINMWHKPFNRAPVIGYMDDLHTLKADDLRAWYRQWYAPNNATLVIVGGVNAQDTVKTVEKLFGGIPARELPPRNDEAENPAFAEPLFTAEIRAATAQPIVGIGWRMPRAQKITDEMPYALEMLSLVLAGTDSARYDKKLQRGDAVALAVSAGYNNYGRKNALFAVTAMPNGGVTPAALKARLTGEIRDIAEHGVTPQELELIRHPLEAEKIFAKDSVRSRADMLGTLEHNGFGWQTEDEVLRRLLAVTPAQVQAAARLLLQSPAAEITVLPQQQNAARQRTGRLKTPSARIIRNKAEK
ncbi:Protease 3 precursor [Kingella potus]|uniref:Protease 3 n=1 Tax=Kingella potus TaxID=265175 RepID=A0A377QZ76_9NEIS|nr:pitrilysin family protein [Kingella potus]STR00543.1 Protease 3 precursor [Kingella potus]